MRPEISLVVKEIYPELEDHSTVNNRPDIRGIGKNYFFMNHEYQE
jgi:hypothetical protein